MTDHPGRAALAAIVDATRGRDGANVVATPRENINAIAAYVAELELAAGVTRECVNCGRRRPAEIGRAGSGDGCPSPDACTWDFTPMDALAIYRERIYKSRNTIAELQAEIKRLRDMSTKSQSVNTTD